MTYDLDVRTYIVDDGIEPAISIPEYKTKGAAAVDLQARIDSEFVLKPGRTIRIPTGVRLAIPEGFEGQVRPRSSLSAKGIRASLGTIDSDFRGEIQVILYNSHSAPVNLNPILFSRYINDNSFVVRRGDRIAQLVICPIPKVQFSLVSIEELGETERGEAGFGSTGR